MEEELMWYVVYDDDSIFVQYEEDGTENAFGSIDRDRLMEFHLIGRTTEKVVLSISMDKDQRLIFRRRNSMSGNTGEKNWTIYMAGWQKTVNGKNVQSINWVFPDGRIVNTGKFQDNHPVFYSPVFSQEESAEEISSTQDGDDG